MPVAPADWYAANKAYQLHHAGCPTCRAAGANPHTQQRCPEGSQLWTTYQSAGLPPHFTWLNRRAGRTNEQDESLRAERQSRGRGRNR